MPGPQARMTKKEHWNEYEHVQLELSLFSTVETLQPLATYYDEPSSM
jgi:hypothetical protein